MMNKSTPNVWHTVVAIVVLITCLLPAVSQARDRGVNQPGAAGNAGAKGGVKDPGVNQPGAAGNTGAKAAGKDSGVNQPGAAGNAAAPAKDPGVNQPGAAGNRRGAGR